MLVARQLSGMVIRVVGILVITRIIGPTEYGLFAGASIIAAVLSTVAIFGLDVHLVRSAPSGRLAEDSAFTLLLAFSVVVGAAGIAAAPLFGSWLDNDGAVGPMRVLSAIVPLMVLWVPARARLERDLEFGRLAAIELSADLIVYIVAVPLAVAGALVWAPVAGFVARHLVLLTATHVVARYRPRLGWDRHEVRQALGFGAGYSAGKWVSIAGQLVNPILVGRLLGPAGVGYVAMSSRIIEQLGAVKQATMRLATAALAKMEGDPKRLRAAHAEGVLAQLLGAVPLYAVAAFLAPWVLPWLFGDQWQPAVKLLALLAVAASFGTLFNLHAQTLQVLGRNAPVARLRALQVGTFAAVTALTVPSLGVIGFGWGRVARTVPFLIVDRDLRRVFSPSYRSGVRWLGALLPMMASPWLSAPLRPLLLIPLAVVLSTATARSEAALVLGRAGVVIRRPGPPAADV